MIQLLNEHAVNASRFQPNPAVAAKLGELSVRCHRRAPWSHGRFEAVFVGLLRIVAAGDPERQIPRDGVQHTATLAEFRRYDLYLVLQTRAFRALVE